MYGMQHNVCWTAALEKWKSALAGKNHFELRVVFAYSKISVSSTAYVAHSEEV